MSIDTAPTAATAPPSGESRNKVLGKVKEVGTRLKEGYRRLRNKDGHRETAGVFIADSISAKLAVKERPEKVFQKLSKGELMQGKFTGNEQWKNATKRSAKKLFVGRVLTDADRAWAGKDANAAGIRTHYEGLTNYDDSKLSNRKKFRAMAEAIYQSRRTAGDKLSDKIQDAKDSKKYQTAVSEARQKAFIDKGSAQTPRQARRMEERLLVAAVKGENITQAEIAKAEENKRTARAQEAATDSQRRQTQEQNKLMETSRQTPLYATIYDEVFAESKIDELKADDIQLGEARDEADKRYKVRSEQLIQDHPDFRATFRKLTLQGVSADEARAQARQVVEQKQASEANSSTVRTPDAGDASGSRPSSETSDTGTESPYASWKDVLGLDDNDASHDLYDKMEHDSRVRDAVSDFTAEQKKALADIDPKDADAIYAEKQRLFGFLLHLLKYAGYAAFGALVAASKASKNSA